MLLPLHDNLYEFFSLRDSGYWRTGLTWDWQTQKSTEGLTGSAWTHRMSHVDLTWVTYPPTKVSIIPTRNLIRYFLSAAECVGSSWPLGMALVGTDAEGIQLRIFAHLMNDQAFVKSLIEGRKEDGTDHSINQKSLQANSG